MENCIKSCISTGGCVSLVSLDLQRLWVGQELQLVLPPVCPSTMVINTLSAPLGTTWLCRNKRHTVI